jgi:hypothetical protein
MKWHIAVIIVLLCGFVSPVTAEQSPLALEPIVAYIAANGKPIGSIGASAVIPLGLSRTAIDVPTTFKSFKITRDLDSKIFRWRCDVLVDGSGIIFTTWMESTRRKTFFWADLSGKWVRAITATDTSDIRAVAPTEYNLKLFEAEKSWWLTVATTGEKKERFFADNTAPQ